MVTSIQADISKAECEVLVNAANGRGYCGGLMSVKQHCKGVAESLQYETKGLIERESKKAIRSIGMKESIIGLPAGSYYITPPCGLKCKVIFHAVTMRNPGKRSSPKAVRECLVSLKNYCIRNGYTDIALPYLGCGTGKIDRDDFKFILVDVFFEDFWILKLFAIN